MSERGVEAGPKNKIEIPLVEVRAIILDAYSEDLSPAEREKILNAKEMDEIEDVLMGDHLDGHAFVISDIYDILFHALIKIRP